MHLRSLGRCLLVVICVKLSKLGPGCSKPTASLVNVSLKFQMLKSELRHYYLSKKCEKLLHREVQKLLIFKFSVYLVIKW